MVVAAHLYEDTNAHSASLGLTQHAEVRIPFDSTDAFPLFRSHSPFFEYIAPDRQVTRPSKPQFPLLGDIAPGWQIIRPLLITVDQDEDGHLIVSDDEFFVYGDGATLEQAQKDLITSLIEYYEILAAHNDAPTQALFQRLRSYLRPIPD